MLAGLEVELLLPRHVAARTTTAARIRVRNLKRHTTSFSIELAGRKDPGTGLPSILKIPVYFPVIPANEAMEAAIQVNFPRRGKHIDNLFVLSTRFPFGFLRRTTAVELRRETLVYPALEPSPEADSLLTQAEGELQARRRGGGSEFHRIRPWESSDSARHVDWKNTAHTGSLHVREYEREEQKAVEIAFDRRTAQDSTAWFEPAVERCAWLAWKLDGQGVEVNFRSQGTSIRLPQHGEVYEILAWLALTEPLGPGGPGPELPEEPGLQDRIRLEISP